MAEYGLLKTDTSNWTYTPKKRYYFAKHAYKFIPAGWRKINITTSSPEGPKIYILLRDPFKHFNVQAFASPDENDMTILVMNLIESEVELTINLKNMNQMMIDHF